MSGRAVEAVAGDWYPGEVLQLHARDGGMVSVEADRHPDPLAEAVRASIAEAELLQAVGRCRGLNRSAEDPVEVVLLGNVPLPGLVVDELRQWEGPTIDDEIFARLGAALESAGDAAKVAGLSREAVKKAKGRLGTFPYKHYSYENVPNLCSVFYQRSGPGRSRRLAVYDRRRIPDMAVWLAERLGPLAYFAEAETDRAPEAEEPAAAEQAEPEAAGPVAGDQPVEPTVEPEVDPGEVEPVAAGSAAAGRKCKWFVFRSEDRSLRHCGREIEPGRTWCPEHIEWSALITSSAGGGLDHAAAARRDGVALRS